MNKLPLAKRAQILGMLVEGNSLRATVRMSDTALNTVTRVLVEGGEACRKFQDKALRNLSCKRIQCDEIWAFCYAKQKNAPDAMKAAGQGGDIWTWTAIDADTKLAASWMIGNRTAAVANAFMVDLAPRLASSAQLTIDGNKLYLDAVAGAFHTGLEPKGVDYAMLVKLYGGDGGNNAPEPKYSPGECRGTIKGSACGAPAEAHVSTSFVERQNLTMRMGMRRFTRLTNDFSKKVEYHAHAVALHFMCYNFGRVHKTLRVTPAMEAGIADHVWSITEIAALVPEPVAKPRGPYKMRAKIQTADQAIST